MYIHKRNLVIIIKKHVLYMFCLTYTLVPLSNFMVLQRIVKLFPLLYKQYLLKILSFSLHRKRVKRRIRRWNMWCFYVIFLLRIRTHKKPIQIVFGKKIIRVLWNTNTDLGKCAFAYLIDPFSTVGYATRKKLYCQNQNSCRPCRVIVT